MLCRHRLDRKDGDGMTYASAIADMKIKVGAAKTSVANAIASLYSVDSATPEQATAINAFLQLLNNASAILVRLEATTTPTDS